MSGVPARDNLRGFMDEVERRLRALERGSMLGYSSIDNGGGVDFYDPGGSYTGGVGGLPDGSGGGVFPANGDPPPQPSPPEVVDGLGAVMVTWDGRFADDAVVPLNWARIGVHVSDVDGFTFDRDNIAATIETPQGGSVIVRRPYDVPTYVLLVAYSTSGVPSLPSEQGEGTALRVIHADLAPLAIEADNVADAAITTRTIAPGAVVGSGIAPGSITGASVADFALAATKFSTLTHVLY